MTTRARMAWTLTIATLAAAPAFAPDNPPPPPNANPNANASNDADANANAAQPAQAQPAQAQPNQAQPPSGPLLNSHQIDRYEAIRQLTQTLKSDPNNLADWVILGELSQEVATDLPPEQADGYYRLARQSYESALKLDPNNEGLKAAAEFARQQEANARQFGQTRKQLTGAYLNARRAELTQAGQPITPTLRVFPPANVADQVAPAAAVNANPPVAGAVPGTNVAGQPAYYPNGYPTYQPFHYQGRPYTYNQYSQGYFPPTLTNNPQAQPMTFRQYSQQLPNVLRNEAGNVLNRAIGGAAGNPAAGVVPPGRP